LLFLVGCICVGEHVRAFSSAAAPSSSPIKTTTTTSPSTSSSNTKSKIIIDVDVVKTQSDIIALADLRYNEWISIDDYENDYNNNNHANENENENPPKPHTPSRYAFRMATKEIHDERSNDGSTVFLARLVNAENNNNVPVPVPAVVGSAELSPIEFNGTILNEEENNEKNKYLYVTDVVTSSTHRRRGIANLLMNALESYAYDEYTIKKKLHVDDKNENDDEVVINNTKITLFLHVKVDNDAAHTFYSNPSRGYCIPTPNQIQNINIPQLEENSGVTSGEQILLCKVLDESCVVQNKEDSSIAANSGGGSSSKAITSVAVAAATAAAIGFSSSSSSSGTPTNTNNKKSLQQKKKPKKVKRKKK
jgi:ribosomal protein S18 acetylase RimI-like enzyme